MGSGPTGFGEFLSDRWGELFFLFLGLPCMEFKGEAWGRSFRSCLVSFRHVWVGISPSRGPITHNPQPECLAYLARR